MSDEKVIVSKGLLDNVAKLLMQATETTDNLSLPEMATAAQMMLPSKWELVVDTTIEQEVSDTRHTIPNADEIIIFAQNKDGLRAKSVTSNYSHYMMMWGVGFIVGGLTATSKTTIIHGSKIGEYVINDGGVISAGCNTYDFSPKTGGFLPIKAKNDTFGLNVQGKGLWAVGTELKIWAKRRVTANE